jgi:hypothetical protein
MLWFARLSLPPGASSRRLRLGRCALGIICTASAAITIATLCWIHEHGGTEVGGYGPSYAREVIDGRRPYVPPQDKR